ncbi:MAG: tRNA (adenosine(37)-N6)-threonylcarbamoyltransferase complex dimerization subunit type 1 TsaB [Bacteroidales bacterium]
MILCLETATSVCSVALADRNGIISERQSSEPRSHATILTVFIEELLGEQNIKASSLEAVVVSKGPGSYTGLRIGVSVAKGISYAAGIPLVGVDTTLSLFNGVFNKIQKEYSGKNPVYCPMIDARRMEVFYCLFDSTGKVIREVTAEVIAADTFSFIEETRPVIIFGDGAVKCPGVINRQNLVHVEGITPRAGNMREAAYQALDAGRAEDLAYFEPFYLKDFVATIPRKNIMA